MAHVVRAWRASRMIRFVILIALFATATQLVLSGHNSVLQHRVPQTTTIGKDRLVSVEPLPQMSGEMCVYPEALSASNPTMMASLQQENALLGRQQASPSAVGGPAAPPRPSEASKADVAKRMPLATIEDPRNAFSAIIVDPVRDEVIMAEENHFGIMVYNRTENTPASAALSEPKRMIRGEGTFLEYICGVYVDPPTGDIYAVNNDTLYWMAVFDRNARGNAAPIRKLRTPQTAYGIVADEETQELLMTSQNDHAVTTFKKSAKDHDVPVRLLQGPKTQMADPHGIALDPKTDLIYVVNWGISNERNYQVDDPRGTRKPNWPVGQGANIPGTGKINPPSITVYPKNAQGDVAPIRVIQGSKTQMNWPTSIAVHPDRGELFVANDTGDSVTVYRTDANGDVAPIRVIKGQRSMIKNPAGVALDLKNNELWVANYGNHSATVYPIDASGDATPKRVIRTGRVTEPSPMMGNPHTVAYDTKRDELLVSS